MFLLAICITLLHNVASDPQYYLGQEDSFYPPSPWAGYPQEAYPKPYGQPPLFPQPQQQQQPQNPFNLLRPGPQTQIVLMDSKVFALYNIIKCIELQGDIKKCTELVEKCDSLFNGKKKNKNDDDDDDDDDKDSKKKKKKKKKKKDEDEEEDEDDE